MVLQCLHFIATGSPSFELNGWTFGPFGFVPLVFRYFGWGNEVWFESLCKWQAVTKWGWKRPLIGHRRYHLIGHRSDHMVGHGEDHLMGHGRNGLTGHGRNWQFTIETDGPRKRLSGGPWKRLSDGLLVQSDPGILWLLPFLTPVTY